MFVCIYVCMERKGDREIVIYRDGREEGRGEGGGEGKGMEGRRGEEF